MKYVLVAVLSWLISTVFLPHGAAAREAPGPVGSEAALIVKRAIDALGGTANLDRVQGYSFDADGVAYRLPARFAFELRGARARTETHTELYQNVRGTDGEIFWETQSWGGPLEKPAKPYTREMNPDVAKRFARQAELFPLLSRWRSNVRPSLIGEAQVGTSVAFIIRFGNEGAPDAEDYLIDKRTFLPLRRTFMAVYEQGLRPVVTTYADYRRVGSIAMPHAIEDAGSDLAEQSVKMRVKKYRLSTKVDTSKFEYPNRFAADEPLSARLEPAPGQVFKEADWHHDTEWDSNPSWGVIYAPTETWTFDLVVDEKAGRWLEPVGAEVTMFAGRDAVKTVKFSGAALKAMRRSILARFRPQAGLMILRHHFTEPMDLGIDRMEYTLNLRRGHEDIAARRTIPVLAPVQKTRLIFPIRGNFVLTSAHAYDDINHKDETSQWGAYDIVVAGPNFELYNQPGPKNSDWVTFGAEVIAPADGVVVYSRNDVPDDTPKDFLESGVPDLLWAYGGNSITIDHGNGEYSFLCHLQLGSVLVKAGDRVKQGQAIGRLGGSQTSGRPHLHYQLQNGPILLRADGLPSWFENVSILRGTTLKRTALPPKKGGLYHAQ